MKRKIIFILLAAGLVTASWAQGLGLQRMLPGISAQRAVESVTVSGSLIVSHGMPAVASGEITYLIMGINRLIGFIEGFKEGAQVSFEGTARANPQNANLKYLNPNKMILAGKTYDLSSPVTAQGTLRDQLPLQNFRFQVPPQNNRQQLDRQPNQPQPNRQQPNRQQPDRRDRQPNRQQPERQRDRLPPNPPSPGRPFQRS